VKRVVKYRHRKDSEALQTVLRKVIETVERGGSAEELGQAVQEAKGVVAGCRKVKL
jgi:hypothetical protein